MNAETEEMGETKSKDKREREREKSLEARVEPFDEGKPLPVI